MKKHSFSRFMATGVLLAGALGSNLFALTPATLSGNSEALRLNRIKGVDRVMLAQSQQQQQQQQQQQAKPPVQTSGSSFTVPDDGFTV